MSCDPDPTVCNTSRSGSITPCPGAVILELTRYWLAYSGVQYIDLTILYEYVLLFQGTLSFIRIIEFVGVAGGGVESRLLACTVCRDACESIAAGG